MACMAHLLLLPDHRFSPMVLAGSHCGFDASAALPRVLRFVLSPLYSGADWPRGYLSNCGRIKLEDGDF